MQKIYLLFLLLIISGGISGQTPFTITESNFPVYENQVFLGPLSTVPSLSPAVDGNWDFSAFTSDETYTNPFIAETDPFYTDEGIDVYVLDFKSLTNTLGYYVYSEFDFNENGVYDRGIYVSEQEYPLTDFTGNANDKIVFPMQTYVYEGGRQTMQFPATYQSSWSSVSRRSVNLNITVSAFGLNNTPFQQVFSFFRTDTVIGWGKMRIHENGVPTIPYDVLMVRSAQFAVDSFYSANGAPAPAPLMAAFGITQGQHTGVTNRYTMFREGYSRPLAIFNYGSNNYTPPANVYFDTQDLNTTGTFQPGQSTFATVLFPNPSTSGDLTLQVVGDAPQFDTYKIYDMEGKIVQKGPAQLENGVLQIRLNDPVINGTYTLQVTGNKKQTLVSEQFVVVR
ncbi:MAG TPA: T9SS type A sorting domain-containing protein [Saprospiraceae bacterium]|nr:T9SS type A sorting domain-containing protein [Saprospiraceae bacterium]HPI05801.1 T9SS type A sorting domain-containing protein [Saprospiraceae bacterium]